MDRVFVRFLTCESGGLVFVRVLTLERNGYGVCKSVNL